MTDRLNPDRLRECMEDQMLSATQLAWDLFGVSATTTRHETSTIEDYLAGMLNPTDKVLRGLATIFGRSVGWLTGGHDKGEDDGTR